MQHAVLVYVESLTVLCAFAGIWVYNPSLAALVWTFVNSKSNDGPPVRHAKITEDGDKRAQVTSSLVGKAVLLPSVSSCGG